MEIKRHYRRLLLLLVMATLLAVQQTTAFAQSAAEKKVTVKVKNQPAEDVLKSIGKQSGLNLFYKSDFAKTWPKLTIDIVNKRAIDAVAEVTNIIGCSYQLKGDIVTIMKQNHSGRKRRIGGRVTDTDGQPLIGVPVCIGETRVCTITDADGAYQIDIPVEKTTLKFTYVGMNTEYAVIPQGTASTTRNITMQSDSRLDEIVVTGYQTLKKENATGSFQKMTSEDLEKRSTTSIMDNLEGQIPGMMSYSTGLNGSGESALSIRGVATFQAKSSPLLVVDGTPIEGSIETLNPYDIASITVLKDAAASSIYGARASNGVIVVVTKRATKRDKMDISFNATLTIAEKQTYDNYGYVGASDAIDTEIKSFDAIFADELGAMYEGFYWPGYASYYSPVGLIYMKHRDGTISDSEYKSSLDRLRKNNYLEEYRDLALRNNITQQYNLALRTKGDRSNNNITFEYKDNNQGFAKEFNRSFNLGYTGDYHLAKWLDASVGVNIRYNNTKTHFEPSRASYLKSPFNFPVYSSMYDDNGNPAYNKADIDLDDPILSNPDAGMKPMGYNLQEQLNYNFTKGENTNIRTFARLRFNITDWLKLSSQFQFEKIKTSSESYLEKGSYAMNFIYNLYTSEGVHHLPDAGILDTGTTNGNYFTFRNQADFNYTIADKHHIEAIAGVETRQTKYRSLNSKILGYDDATQSNHMSSLNIYQLSKLGSTDLFASLGRIAPTQYYNILYRGGYYDGAAFGTSDVMHRYVSLYFNANYTFDKRYSLSASWRKDKTDLFGADPKYRGRPLWSVGASWNLQNEAFMKDVKAVDMLKLRLSYGVTGNIDSSVSSYLVGRIYTNRITLDKSAYLSTPPNDQLRWEKTTSWNVGVDYSLFGNRLMGSLDFYRKYSTDLLSHTALDPSEGFSLLTINNGEASNTGVELQVNADILRPQSRNDFGLNLAYCVSYNKNKVEKVTYDPGALVLLGWGQSSHALVEGNAVNSLYALPYAGNDENGYMQWYKADGTATTDLVWDVTKEDIVCMGTLDPKVTMSLTPTVSYKGFALSAMFAYYGGHVMRTNTDQWSAMCSLTGYGNVLQSVFDYYNSPETYTMPLPSIQNALTSMNTGQSLMYLDKAVVDADYMKLRNIVLSYAIPRTFCSSLGITSASVRLQMNNVAKWVKNDLGIDPEANNAWTGYNTNSPMRSYTLNLNINF